MYENQGMQLFPGILKRRAIESINATAQLIKQLMLCFCTLLLDITHKN